MKLRYLGPKGHRRVEGKRLSTGQEIDVKGDLTIAYFLGLKLNDGKPEFERAGGEAPAEPEMILDTTAAGDEE